MKASPNKPPTARLTMTKMICFNLSSPTEMKARPMSDAALEAKFRGLTDGVLSNDETDRLIELCWKIETVGDVADLARAAVPAAAVGA